MKFEYDSKSEERECVAYMFRGYLVMRDDVGRATAIGVGDFRVCGHTWNPSSATRRFYPGDKLTITF